jgi:hypothetical protein
MMSFKLTGSKKAVGLGFVAIIVLLALVLFIFKYSTIVYEFHMKAGEERAHLVTAYTELEKAKIVTSDALRQVTYELLWDEKVAADAAAKTCSFASVCGDAVKEKNQDLVGKEFYDLYASRYETYSELLETELPGEYRIGLKCDEANKIKVEAFGYSEECYLSNRFAFPEFPCEDQDDPVKCAAVKVIGGNSPACIWDFGVCEEKNPEPDCSSASSEAECKSKSDKCDWLVSYSEKIKVSSPLSPDYKFEAQSDAHLLENITCDDYLKFADVRKLAPKYAVGMIRVTKDETVSPPSYKIEFKVDNIGDEEPKVSIIDPDIVKHLPDETIPGESEEADSYSDSKYRKYRFQVGLTGKYLLQIYLYDILLSKDKLLVSTPFIVG